MVEKIRNVSKRRIIYHIAFFCKFIICIFATGSLNGIDLTLVGQAWHGDGLGKILINFIECLKDRVSINWMPARGAEPVYQDLPQSAQQIIKKSSSSKVGKVAILTDIPWCIGQKKASLLPRGALIKLAYSMIESTRIPKEWVTIFNKYFDAVVVPDTFFVKVYKDSGVTIPIFVVPIAMDLKPFLGTPFKKGRGKPFIFGNLSQVRPHKNLELLIRAFAKAFGNNPDVKLVLNARYADNPNLLRAIIKETGAQNIEFYHKPLAFNEMLALMKSFDCYVSFSKGEGFSLIPREILALGIPVIISDNTAQRTICKTGYVRGVPQSGTSKAHYEHLAGDCGVQFETSLQDAVNSLLDVYNNYTFYLDKARKGRKWVEKYTVDNLRPYYANLVKPKEVVRGSRNAITARFLVTSDSKLFEKYLKLGAKQVAETKQAKKGTRSTVGKKTY